MFAIALALMMTIPFVANELNRGFGRGHREEQIPRRLCINCLFVPLKLHIMYYDECNGTCDNAEVCVLSEVDVCRTSGDRR